LLCRVHEQALVITLLGNDQFFSVVGACTNSFTSHWEQSKDLSTGTYLGSICSGSLIVNSLVRVIRGNGHKRTALMAEETNFRCGSRILTWGWGSNLEVSGTRGREPLFFV
jgi:hypothetical protein